MTKPESVELANQLGILIEAGRNPKTIGKTERGQARNLYFRKGRPSSNQPESVCSLQRPLANQVSQLGWQPAEE
jgi:hypothetical protein